MDLSTTEMITFAAMLVAAGVGAGIIAGLLGVGGGLVIVPVLSYILSHLGVHKDILHQVCVGTSLATIMATAWSSTAAHYRRGGVDLAFLKAYGPAVIFGVFLGAAIAAHVKGQTMTLIFAVVGTLLAAQIALGNPRWRLGNELPQGPLRLVIGTVIGTLSSMMGIGGGSITVPVMTMYGTQIHRAVGTAAATGFLIGVPGAIGYIIGGWGVEGLPPGSLGFVNVIALVLIIPTSVLCAPLGARLAHRLDMVVLRRIFAVFLVVTMAKMLFG